MARKHKVGAGNLVQPNEDGEYDVVVNWQVFDRADSYVEAVRRLHELVPKDKPIIRINESRRQAYANAAHHDHQ